MTRNIAPARTARTFAQALCCATSLLLAVVAPRAEAQSGTPQGALAGAQVEPPAEYRQVVHEAVTDYEAKLFLEARARFLRAHELYPNARTLRGLGMVEFELRDYPRSIHYLEQALASEVRALDADLRQETQLLLQRARAYVGEVRAQLEPAEASLFVDGELRAKGPEARLLLLAGDHVLDVRAQGYKSERRSVAVRSEKELHLTIKLEPEKAPAGLLSVPRPIEEPARTMPSEPAKEPRLVRKWWLWTTVGVAVVGAVVGGVLIARARDDVSEPTRTPNQAPDVVLSALSVSP